MCVCVFSHSITSYSLQPHGLQDTGLPYPVPAPWAYSSSRPLRRWCHPTISSSVIPVSPCLQTFPASGSFLKSQLFASGGQSIEISAVTSVPPMNTQDWFLLGKTGWISLESKRLWRVFFNTQFKDINYSALSCLYSLTLISMHAYWKNHSLD